MLPKLLLTIRTADRTPKRNYLGRTVLSLLSQRVATGDIHLCPTDPDIAWMPYSEPHGVWVHAPHRRVTANENGIAQVALLDHFKADWIVMSEDDLEWCDDPIGSMARWLDDHARPDVSVYRFFTFDRLTLCGTHVASVPLHEQKGSQVVAMRAADARRFAEWAHAHQANWRPKSAPFQGRTHDGFDKLIGYWALQDRPSTTVGLVSWPFFVRHIGVESSLHAFGKRIDASFAGESWSYKGTPCQA